tara:strand:+ start:3240 stop:3794 length:555 start_codon:yes stop_codon:yes gene_type:complete
MADLYIRVDGDNKPINHPNLKTDLMKVYPKHDFDLGPPNGWKVFIRKERPKLSPYEIFDESVGADIAMGFQHNGLEYKLVGDHYEDYWHIKTISEEEQVAKQQKIEKEFIENTKFTTWVLNKETCLMEPPTPFPSDFDTVQYKWNDTKKEWVEAKGEAFTPQDDPPPKNSIWDEENKVWKEVTE